MYTYCIHIIVLNLELDNILILSCYLSQYCTDVLKEGMRAYLSSGFVFLLGQDELKCKHPIPLFLETSTQYFALSKLQKIYKSTHVSISFMHMNDKYNYFYLQYLRHVKHFINIENMLSKKGEA